MINEELKNRIETLASKYKLKDLIECSKNITNRYLNKSNNNDRLLTSKEEVLTYSIVRMPATLGALSFSLEKMLELLPDNDINTILDVGGGTGTSYFALSSNLDHEFSLTIIEREKEMISLAKSLINDEQHVSILNMDFTKEFIKNKYDLVLSSYFLNELDDEMTFKALNSLVEVTNKYLLLVDPGTPENFLKLLKIRKYLLDKGMYLLGPCPHNKECPIKEGDWCHFVTRIQRSKLHRLLKEGDVPYEDEKFTFIALSKLPISSNNQSRILRHPLISSGFVKVKLCTKEGVIEEQVITKSNKEKYKTVKKANVGDII